MPRAPVLTTALVVTLLAIVPSYDRVFATPAWRGPALGAALLALVLAAAVRRLGGGAVAALAVSVVGFVAVTTALHAPDTGLLPDAETRAALAGLVTEAVTELRTVPAPAPPLPGLMLVVTSGWWVITHLAHELLLRRHRPGAALIALVVLWAAPLAVPLPPGPSWPQALPFLAAAGLVLLLTADRSAPVAAPSGSALALGGVALVVAVLLPGVLPGYGQPAWVDVRSSVQSRGYQPIVDVSRRLQLPEERDVLRVRADRRTYLRLAGLDTFDGFTWRLGPGDTPIYRPDPASLFSATEVLPPEAQAAEIEPVFVDIEVLALENIYVPTPYQPVQVLGPAREEMVWSTDGGFLATWESEDGVLADDPHLGVREGTTYRVQAARPAPTIEQLRDVSYDEATLERWTRLPRPYERLAEVADEVYEDAGAATTIDRVLALQNWFALDGEFTYDLEVAALRGEDALERFVIEDRVGYCEYFATAMAVMLRATGIPARVATGFLPGRVTAEPGEDDPLTEFTVSTSDAHAWVEVLFPGYGWVTFEPTPRSDQTQIIPRADDLAPIENEQERRARELEELIASLPDDVPVPDAPDLSELGLPDAAPDAATDEPATGAASARWMAITLAIVGAVAFTLLRRHRRGRSSPLGPQGPRHQVLAAQRRLFATARRHGVGRRPAETVAEVVARWAGEGRIHSEGARFASLAQAAAFGGELDDALAREAERLAGVLERDLRASVPRQDRLAAPVRIPAAASAAALRRTGIRLLERDRRRSGAG